MTALTGRAASPTVRCVRLQAYTGSAAGGLTCGAAGLTGSLNADLCWFADGSTGPTVDAIRLSVGTGSVAFGLRGGAGRLTTSLDAEESRVTLVSTLAAVVAIGVLVHTAVVTFVEACGAIAQTCLTNSSRRAYIVTHATVCGVVLCVGACALTTGLTLRANLTTSTAVVGIGLWINTGGSTNLLS